MQIYLQYTQTTRGVVNTRGIFNIMKGNEPCVQKHFLKANICKYKHIIIGGK